MFKIRFWWVVFKAFLWRAVARKTTTVSKIPFWVTPFDCDINLHCNNASYLKYMDLGRWDLLIRMGLFRALLKARLRPVAVNVNINFKKALPPMAFFYLVTEHEEISEKVVSVKQTFYFHGKVAAEALVKAVILKDGRAIPSERFVRLLPPGFRLRR